jgi:hypothetical protein
MEAWKGKITTKYVYHSSLRTVLAVGHQLAKALPHILVIRITFYRIGLFLRIFAVYYLVDCQFEGIV